MIASQELHCFDTSSDFDDGMLEPMHFLFNETETQSAFSHLTPALKSGGEKASQVVHNFTQKLSNSKLDDLLEGSIHTMVPMRMIAHAIINSMIYEKPKQTTDLDTNDDLKQLGNNQSELKKIGKNIIVDDLAEDLSKIALEPVTWTSMLT